MPHCLGQVWTTIRSGQALMIRLLGESWSQAGIGVHRSRQSRTPRSHSSRFAIVAGSDRSNKAPRPKRCFHFFRHWKGRPAKPGQILGGAIGVMGIGLLPIGDRLPDPPSHQPRKHPGKQGPEHQQYQHEQPSETTVRLVSAFASSVMKLPTGNQGHRQSRLSPAKLPPLLAWVSSPPDNSARCAASQRCVGIWRGAIPIGLFIGSRGEGSPFAWPQALTLFHHTKFIHGSPSSPSPIPKFAAIAILRRCTHGFQQTRKAFKSSSPSDLPSAQAPKPREAWRKQLQGKPVVVDVYGKLCSACKKHRSKPSPSSSRICREP